MHTYTRAQQTLADLSGREKELERNEEDLHRRQTKLEDDYQRKLMDLQDASRRLEQDFLHQTRLQAEKVKGLEEDLKHSKALAAQYQQEGFELRREIASLQTQLHQGPNVRQECLQDTESCILCVCVCVCPRSEIRLSLLQWFDPSFVNVVVHAVLFICYQY